MNTVYNTQLTAIDRYFTHLGNFGYMPDYKVRQMLTAILLIDSLEYFKEFITKEFIDNVNRILRNLDCCNCLIDFEEIKCEEIEVEPEPCDESLRTINGVSMTHLASSWDEFVTYVKAHSTVTNVEADSGMSKNDIEEVLITTEDFVDPLTSSSPYHIYFVLGNSTTAIKYLWNGTDNTTLPQYWKFEYFNNVPITTYIKDCDEEE